MTYIVLYVDGLGNPREWSRRSSAVAAARSLARLEAFLGPAFAGARARVVAR